ncbi:hypothetical protein ONE63_002999 [Megalurothrips usitatus]|uniref:Riboflavin transporter n=1 Tax=Megalurothrips usitatus TaxID=439358 RepID=A0AAV7X5Z4_9NEOP|nr:hypothetical protein ONE63_002999 [Megalurothrips usitatus]
MPEDADKMTASWAASPTAAAPASRVVLVDVLAALFGLGAWLGVNAMYTQLPILVEVLPESWNVASYIVVVIQAANIGGVAYAVVQRHHGDVADGGLLERGCIYAMTALGCASLLLMAFFYQEVVVVAGAAHSVPLLLLVFGCALPACVSSVLFVPYLRRFPPTYLVSYMVGEGLSGLLPSALSLVQGVAGDAVCAAAADGTRAPYTPPPVFSTRTYLLVAFLLQAASAAAFALLDLLPVCRRVRAEARTAAAADKQRAGPGAAPLSSSAFAALLAAEAVLMFFSNGLFPSVQTYSCEPYGTLAYHLAINLGAMANPLSCYLLFFVAARRPRTIAALTAATLAVAAYILVGAALSPTPPLVGQTGGQVLVVSSAAKELGKTNDI